MENIGEIIAATLFGVIVLFIAWGVLIPPKGVENSAQMRKSDGKANEWISNVSGYRIYALLGIVMTAVLLGMTLGRALA